MLPPLPHRAAIAPLWLATLVLMGGDVHAQPAMATREIGLEVVTVDDSPAACPSAAAVREALNARIPGVMLADAGRGGGAPVRLALTHTGPGAIRIELIDPNGTVALERALQMMLPDSTARRADRHGNPGCAALADTVSLIVERYLRHVGYRDRPAPSDEVIATPAPVDAAATESGLRAVLLGAGADVSAGHRQPDGVTQWTEYASLSLGLHWRRAVVSAGAGIGRATRTAPIADTDAGYFSYLPVPLRVSAGLRLPLGWGVVLLPQVGTGADLLFKSAHGIPGGGFDVTAEPVAEAGSECLLPLGRRAFVNAHLWAVLNVRPHDFVLRGMATPVLGTPRVYALGGLQVGLVFDAGGARWNR